MSPREGPTSHPMTSRLVLGTAGHIDHGKSALVRALTGIDPDRLAEEQARGITIDLGFAHVTLDGVDVAFVDVPGHERFVRNMLAGAGGFDAVLLAVAADDGIKPQTREHLAICQLVGLTDGVVALTKRDLVDQVTAEVRAMEIADLLAGTPLAGAAIVPVSAKTGDGLDDLRAAIVALAPRVGARARAAAVRLPIDRVFSVKGFGTVVTGTLVSGAIATGQSLQALPQDEPVRVRGIQVHGRDVPQVSAPARVALNLGAIAVRDLARGTTLAEPGSLAVTRRVDMRLHALPDARALPHNGRVRLYHGTSEVIGRVSIAAMRQTPRHPWNAISAGTRAVSVPPGWEACVRVRLEADAVFTRGDRVVVRAYSPLATIAGGVVLDPQPGPGGIRRPASLARFTRLLAEGAAIDVWIDEAGWRGVAATSLPGRSGLARDAAERAVSTLVSSGVAVVAGDRLYARRLVDDLSEKSLQVLAAFHDTEPLEPGLAVGSLHERAMPRVPRPVVDLVLAGLRDRGAIVGRDRVAIATRAPAGPPEDPAAMAIARAASAAALQALNRDEIVTAGCAPPAVVDALLRRLVSEGRLVRVSELYFDRGALDGLTREIRALKATRTADVLDVASFKERFGLTRKHAIPLLEWLDRERVTRREGNVRRIL